MSDLLPYSKEFSSLLNVFKPHFSKPQFENFSQTTHGIVLSSHSTISRFSKAFEREDSSSMTKFLTQSPWDEAKVKTNLHKMLFKTITGLDIFIFDDTISEKPFAEVMTGVDSHYSNLKKGQCKGHSLFTCGFYTPEGCVPFDIQMYFRQEKATELRREFKTKNDLAVEKLRLASSMHNFKYCVFDSWYSNVQVIGEIKRLQKKFIVPIKSNRNVTINKKRREVKNHCKDIPISEYTDRIINDNLFRYYETDAFISKIRTVRLLFCQMWQDNEQWSDTCYLIANDMESSPEKIIETYLKRNSIEPFHREAKQQLGMDEYQMRNLRGIERYLFLVLLVYILLMVLNKLLMHKGEVRLTLGELRVCVREECYTTLLCHANALDTSRKRRIAHNLAVGL